MKFKTNVCQRIMNSECSVRTSRKFHFEELELEELPQPSTKIRGYLQTVSTQDIMFPLIGNSQQQPNLGENKPASSWVGN